MGDMTTGSGSVCAANGKAPTAEEKESERIGKEMKSAEERFEKWKADHPDEKLWSGDTPNPDAAKEILKILVSKDPPPTTAAMLDAALRANGGNMALAARSMASALGGYAGEEYGRFVDNEWTEAARLPAPAARWSAIADALKTKYGWVSTAFGLAAKAKNLGSIIPDGYQSTEWGKEKTAALNKNKQEDVGRGAAAAYKRKGGPASKLGDLTTCLTPALPKQTNTLINGLPAHTKNDKIVCNHGTCKIDDGLDNVQVNSVPLAVVDTSAQDAWKKKVEEQQKKLLTKQQKNNTCVPATIRNVLRERGIAEDQLPTEDAIVAKAKEMGAWTNEGTIPGSGGVAVNKIGDVFNAFGKDFGVTGTALEVTKDNALSAIQAAVANGDRVIGVIEQSSGLYHAVLFEAFPESGMMFVTDPSGGVWENLVSTSTYKFPDHGFIVKVPGPWGG